ncbi:MAG: EamA family transporter [Acidiferrobacteraceae bacterium]|nr:EamA family transporter [Acidiferrobacteraceae bacterium]
MPVPKNQQTENLAKLSCIFVAVVWGLFWIPLRALNEAGISEMWATVLFSAVPLLLLIPLLLVRWKSISALGWTLHKIGIAISIAFVFYSNAFFYTDVIPVLLLFYMTVIWGTLFARIWLKEPITFARITAIVCGFSGMFVILSVGPGIPIPSNFGDWLALLAGISWAFGAVLMKREEEIDPRDLVICYFFWATVLAVVMAVIPISIHTPSPGYNEIIVVLPWFLPIVLLLLIPSVFALLWGAPMLSPGVTGILFLTEISVATIAVAILTDEPFGIREVLGILLISLAGASEVIFTLFRRRLK